MNTKKINRLFLVLLLTLPAVLYAAEFRAIRPIPVPAAVPEVAMQVKTFKPVSRKIVERAVLRLMSSWNKAQLSQMISDKYYDKDRLSDALDTYAPRDAKLRVLSIQGVQTLQQLEQHHPDDPNRMLTVSRVSVTVRTQVEFNDPVNGFQSRVGTNEYILKVTQ